MTESKLGQNIVPMSESDLLRASGIPVTAQRIAVIKAVKRRAHATADDLVEEVKKEIGAISRQAVYNVLSLLTEKGIPGSDIKVETSQGVVSLSSDVKVTESQKEEAVRITKNIKGVKSVMSDGLKAE